MKQRFLRIHFLLFVSTSLSCFSGTALDQGHLHASGESRLGSFTIASKTVGDADLHPSGCTSGGRQYYLGGEFRDPSSPILVRLVVDPLNGPAVRVFSSQKPFDQSVVFHRADCAVFHFSLDGTGWQINDSYDYRLTLELDCSRDGESIRGTAAATHCH